MDISNGIDDPHCQSRNSHGDGKQENIVAQRDDGKYDRDDKCGDEQSSKGTEQPWRKKVDTFIYNDIGLFMKSFGEIYECSQIASLRPLENASDRAADQQAELLGEKHPRDLTERWVCLTLQVQNCRSEKGNAESKAEEDAPVGQCVMGIPFEQGQDPLVDKHFGSNLNGTGVKGVVDVL